MKTAKLVIGILSIVLSLFVLFQSCITGVSNAIEENEEDTSGGAGVLVSILLIAAGIVAIAARKSKGGAIATAILYALGGIIGIANMGTFSDLVVWSVLCFIFAAVFIISIFTQQYPDKNKPVQ